MLENIKILSFTHYMQGPAAAQYLADLGADVIKVERMTGAYERGWSAADSYLNGVSVFFLMANRNERSIALDLKSDEGRQIIYDLVGEYDVVIENFRAGAMDRLGLSYETLRKINPRLVYCSCTGWGADGPMAQSDGQDLLAQSVSGLISQNGPGDHAPYAMGTTLVDVHGAALAALGLLAAVYERDRTGIGRKVDACLLNAAIDLEVEPLTVFLNTGRQMPRLSTGLGTRVHSSLYGSYVTKDGYICVNCRDGEKIKRAFGEHILDGIEYCFDNRGEIDRILSDALKTKTTAEWTDIFAACRIRHAPVNDYPAVLADGQVVHNRIVTEIEYPKAGKVKLINHPNRFDGEPPAIRRLPPGLGQHTREVLRACGYDDARIDALRDKGVINVGEEA